MPSHHPGTTVPAHNVRVCVRVPLGELDVCQEDMFVSGSKRKPHPFFPADPHSFANFDEAKLTQIDLRLECDFAKQRFFGYAVSCIPFFGQIPLLWTRHALINQGEIASTVTPKCCVSRVLISHSLAPQRVRSHGPGAEARHQVPAARCGRS